MLSGSDDSADDDTEAEAHRKRSAREARASRRAAAKDSLARPRKEVAKPHLKPKPAVAAKDDELPGTAGSGSSIADGGTPLV